MSTTFHNHVKHKDTGSREYEKKNTHLLIFMLLSDEVFVRVVKEKISTTF